MKHRSYNQLCGMAVALDLIGDRWTLLIIRELIAGPRRFTDLLDGLPGISTNLLTERLKLLEHNELIAREHLPPPAAATVYGLTEVGLGLEPMLIELGRWGSQFIPRQPESCVMLRAGSYALALKTFFRPALTTGLDEAYTLRIDNDLLQVRAHNGLLDVQQGTPWPAVMELRTTTPVYLGLLQGLLEPDAVLASGEAQLTGDPTALPRFLAICGIADPAPLVDE